MPTIHKGWRESHPKNKMTAVNIEDFEKWIGSSHRKTKAFAEYADVVEKKVEDDIEERAKRDGTFMKAPNGKKSRLSERQWVQVRTKAFKAWFGDWEKHFRIKKLRESKPIIITGDEYKSKYELNRDSANKWIKDNLREKPLHIDDTNEDVLLEKTGANKVTSHSMGTDAHIKSIVSIPLLLKNAVFITELPNEKGNNKFDSYRYYVCGLRIVGVDYTAKITIGVKQGKRYYDHALTEIEKGKLLDRINDQADISERNFKTTGNASLPSSEPFLGKDTKLLTILQTNSSKIVDENGNTGSGVQIGGHKKSVSVAYEPCNRRACSWNVHETHGKYNK